jgi:hypothetical protein
VLPPDTGQGDGGGGGAPFVAAPRATGPVNPPPPQPAKVTGGAVAPIEVAGATAAGPPAALLFANLSIGLVAGDPLTPGLPQEATFTWLLLNPGALDANGPLTVVHALPTGVTFEDVLSPGWTCDSEDGQYVTCTSDSPLGQGAETQLVLLVRSTEDAVFPALSTATVVSPSLDPNAPLPTTVDALPVLSDTAQALNVPAPRSRDDGSPRDHDAALPNRADPFAPVDLHV